MSSDNVNFYDRIKNDIKYRNPVKDAPQHPWNAIFIGGTGSGKTLSLFNVMRHSQNFDNFIIVTKQPDEPLYGYLEKLIKDIAPDRITLVDNISKMPSIDDLDPDLQTLLIFDDQIAEPKKTQEQITQIMIRSRKRNVSVAYLSQSYYAIPKTIRLNSQYVILKSIASKKEIKAIIRDYALVIDDNKLLKMFNDSTSNLLDFFMIDIKSKNQGNEDMAYRKNFTPINKKESKKTIKSVRTKKRTVGRGVSIKKEMSDLEYLKSLKK